MLLPKTISSSVERILIFSLFALNALAFVFIAAAVPVWTTNDTPRYLDLADNFANGVFGLMTSHGFEIEGVRSFGYPFFILVCRILPGDIEFNVVIVQGILYLISVFFVWKLVKRNFGTEVSYVFLILLLFYPFIAYQSCVLSPETICLFLLSLAAVILDFSLRKDFPRAGFAAAGLLIALSMYFRSNLFPLPFFLTLIFLFTFKKHRKAVLFLPVTAILTMLPATIYNYHNFNVITPTPVYGGAQTSLWMAVWHARLSTDEMLKYRRNEITPTIASSGMPEQLAEINRKIGVSEDFFPINMGYYEDNATRERVQREFGKAAVENIRETPAVYLKSSLINIFRMWFSAHLSNQGFSDLLRLYLLFAGFFVFLSGLIGLLLSIKNFVHPAAPFVVTAIAIIVFHSITLCWSHTEARYTIPARLFLLAFAAYAIAEFLKQMRKCFKSLQTKI
ncbi:MAG: glycosyltransferase family 39 protein [Pyrinomonadaceae bacterium]|nr:glycosyltransferase family 39 protein [Pyrinomonadaceae bacterium]